MKAGRNDPCPCGSGEKYKKCCLLKETEERSGDVLFREAEASLMERLLPFADDAFGEQAIDQAWFLFLEEMTEVNFDPEDPLNLLFIPWFLFNWMIEDEDSKSSPTAPLNTTVAEAFMKAKVGNISDEDLAILKASNRRPLSFFEVLDIVPGKSLKLFDLMLNALIEVEEDTASQTLQKGEIVIGSMMLPLKGKIRPLNLGPFALPKECKEDVIDLRDELLEKSGKPEMEVKIMHEQEAFTIGLYLDLLEEILEDEDEDGQPPQA